MPKKGDTGWWASHDFKKRSVEEIENFVGWEYLEKLVEKCERERDRALIASLFETGGRVSEVLLLTKDMFLVQDPYLIVRAMPVLKRYEKIGVDEKGKWITKKKKGYRTFPIHCREPLVSYLEDWLNTLEGKRLFDIGRVRVYQIVKEIDPEIFPHWFRGQRASQLALEYGFSIHDLVDFFNWKDLQTAIHYSRMGWKGLADKMMRGRSK